MAIFETLRLWIDPVRRRGPEAMAVDEWLLDTVTCPVLRIYSWTGDWVSIGYFGKVSEAREIFPTLSLVRRWTGGGIVDHRSDWTYTLVVPKLDSLARAKGAESYRLVHEKLMETIEQEDVECKLSPGGQETGSACCFENPTGFDIVSKSGGKIAGAGQRRTKNGLLHQGSVHFALKDAAASIQRAELFADKLAQRLEKFHAEEDECDIATRVQARYSCPAWTNRR